GVANGNTIFGTVSGTGLYTAPAVMPSPASVTVTAISQVNPGEEAAATVTVTAASVADPTKAGNAIVTIACANPNAIAPPSAQVALGQLQTFTATFCGAAGAQVAWDVNRISGG